MVLVVQILLSNARSLFSSTKLQAITASSASSIVACAVIGGTVGVSFGAITGAFAGLFFALFTFGLSIPFCIAAGCIIGVYAGVLLGGAAGYADVPKRVWRKAGHARDYKQLILNSSYGKSNSLSQVRCGKDISDEFNACSKAATDVGHRITLYLQNAVDLYRVLNDNKTGVSPLKSAVNPDDATASPPELCTFETIAGNFERSGQDSGWMLVKREAPSSPVGKRELWLVVRGSTTLDDWTMDAEALAPPTDVGLDTVGICSGFYRKAESIINNMMSQKALEAVRREATIPFHKLFIVGHSLAGAVVTQFQSFGAIPFTSPNVELTQSAQDMFGKLQQIWAAALGAEVWSNITTDNVFNHFLTFALEPAPAFKSKRGPKHWEADAYALQTKDSFVKRILEQTLVLTIYGADPVPRLNIEIAGMALPPVKLGLFYSSPHTSVMPKKYYVDVNTFYLMHGPLADNRMARFLTWFSVCHDTFGGRIAQMVNLLRAIDDPKSALQLAVGHLGVDHVAMFRPDVFVKGLQDLPQR